MKFNKNSFFLVLFLTVSSNFLLAQKNVKTNNGLYQKEIQSLQTSIQKNFYDKASGYYLIVVDPAKREKKGITCGSSPIYGRFVPCIRQPMKLKNLTQVLI